jgi:hypothetical protein
MFNCYSSDRWGYLHCVEDGREKKSFSHMKGNLGGIRVCVREGKGEYMGCG